MVEEEKALLSKLVSSAQTRREEASSLKDILLANLVMVGETPSETFKEEKRVRFVLDRFREAGLDKISSDEVNNALAVLPGKVGKRSILVCAHLDTLFEEGVDHTVTVGTETVQGAGIADNSLGVAMLCSLPNVLQHCKVELQSDLILMGASRGLGRGDIQGIDFFLEHHPGEVFAGVCIEGVDLGRLSYQSIGMLRGEITCRIPSGASRGAAHAGLGTIEPLAEVVRLIEQIPTPLRPLTTINLGALRAGTSFHQTATKGSLRFEVRSAQVGMVATIQERLEEIVSKVALETGVELNLEIIARRRNGGIEFEHPLVRATRSVMEELGVKPEVRPSVGELSSLISRDIPGVTLGLTESCEAEEGKEGVRIEPLFSGVAQLVTMLQAIDAGVCDGQEE